MKNCFAIIFALMLSLGSFKSMAQHQSTADTAAIENKFVIRKDGKAWMMKYNQMMEIHDKLTLENGYNILPGAVVVTDKGKKINLKEGELMYLYGDKLGKIVPVSQHEEAAAKKEKNSEISH